MRRVGACSRRPRRCKTKQTRSPQERHDDVNRACATRVINCGFVQFQSVLNFRSTLALTRGNCSYPTNILWAPCSFNLLHTLLYIFLLSQRYVGLRSWHRVLPERTTCTASDTRDTCDRCSVCCDCWISVSLYFISATAHGYR